MTKKSSLNISNNLSEKKRQTTGNQILWYYLSFIPSGKATYVQ